MVLLVLLGGRSAHARLLLLESPLESLAPLPADARRLEFSSTAFGAQHWAGQRLQLRYAGSRGTQLSWSLALPWLYSSYANGGRSGRDNLFLGAGLRVLGDEGARLRVGGELWLPFAAPELAPLGERRAFGRLALLAGGGPRAPLQVSLSWRTELRGLGPELDASADQRIWPERWNLDARLGRFPAAGLAAFVRGGSSLQYDDGKRRQLGWIGGGAQFAWGEVFSVELSGEGWLGLGGDPVRPDYRLRLTLRRDAIAPPAPAEPASPGEPSSSGS
ncbi:MAG: hypothetical protein R3C71_15565 [Candidatus Krumholzibacteriia bacterium]|nr:hypothetical protein [bacterium]MCB9514170.1 hypothetical protein [Candidatus Latescibacterota bacterium]MCB9515829.1 hypothetical protein [Candidatus Latescibacterota bacterium]